MKVHARSTSGLGLFITALTALAWPLTSAGQSNTAAAPAVSVVRGAPLAESRHEIRAQLLPRRYTTLAAEIGARIQSLPVAEGGGFTEGQLLVAFDCAMHQAQLDKAKAELDGAELTYQANQRMAVLNSVGQLELDVSRATAQRARAEVAGQQALNAKCQITAPFSGRVAEQKVREQQFVQPGQVLLDILDDSVMELEFLVPSSWLTWLKPGQSLQVRIDETRKTYPARFTRVGARVDPVSQTVKVAAAIDGRFPELVSGMSGRVQVSESATGSKTPKQP